MLRILMTWLVAVALLMGTVAPAVAYPLSSSSHILVAQTVAKKSLFSFSGTRPVNLGVRDGKFAACPSSPNCVSSQSPESDAEHYIPAMTFTGSAPGAIARLKEVISSLPRTEIIQQSENYLYAEFTTPLMGFVDDVEFFADAETGTLHVRSASRLGESDLGVNRKRVEEIRAALDA